MRLLLVEDNERFAALLKKGLGASGFAVDIIATAEDATAALKARRWDIIVLDLGLPMPMASTCWPICGGAPIRRRC